MGERTADVQDADLAETLAALTKIIKDRQNADPELSYTARLLSGPVDGLLKKLVEEAAELVLAVKDDDHDHIRYEAADLVYHLSVLLQRTGITSEELAGELRARMI